MADKDIKIIIETLLKSDKFKKGIQDMTTRAKKSTKAMNMLKGALSGIGVAFVATKIIAGFKAIIKVGMEFEQSIANVASVSGDARGELESLAREAGKTTVFSARQAADAMYFLASAGLAVEDMAKVLNPTLNLAAAAQMDIAAATDLVVNNLKVFGAEMNEAEKYTDIMAKTVSSSNTNMEQLGQALSFAGAVAAQNGIEFEDLNAILGVMADQGIKGTRAGTQLRMALTRLIKPTTRAQEVLAKYGITQEQVNDSLSDPIKLFKLLEPVVQNSADATEVFGVRQQNVIGIIKNGIPSLEKLKESLGDAGGAAQRMADEQIDTLEGQLKLLKSAWEELNLQITGDTGFNELLKDSVTILKDVVLAISGFIKKMSDIKKSTVGVRAIAIAFLTLKAAISPIQAFVTAFFTTFRDNLIQFKDNILTAGRIFQKVFTGDFKGAMDEAKKAVFDTGKSLVKTAAVWPQAWKNAVELNKKNVVEFLETWDSAGAMAVENAKKRNNDRAQNTKDNLNSMGESEKEYQETKKTLTEKELADIQKLTETTKQSEIEKIQAKIDALNNYLTEYELSKEQERKIFEAIEEYKKQKSNETTSSLLSNTKKLFNQTSDIAGSLVTVFKNASDRRLENDKEAAVRLAKMARGIAVVNKISGATSAIINGFIASMAIMANPNPLIPFTVRKIQSTLAKVQGFAAAAAIMAKPLPEVPSFKSGTEMTPAGPAMLHAGERIIPAEMNVPSVSNEAFAAAAMRGLGFGGSGGPSNYYTTTTQSTDNTKKVYNFYGIRDISAARNQLLRTEGQGAF